MTAAAHLTPGQNKNASVHRQLAWHLALSMVIAADGNSYKLALQEEDNKCHFTFFTDEPGMIYQGKVIDCSVDRRRRGLMERQNAMRQSYLS